MPRPVLTREDIALRKFARPHVVGARARANRLSHGATSVRINRRFARKRAPTR